MKPGLGRRKKFDIVILPKHDMRYTDDGIRNTNTLITQTAPNRITDTTIEEAVSRITHHASRITEYGIGILIGGDAKHFRLTKDAVKDVVDGILRITEEMAIDIFISTSRRTSDEIDSFLKDRLSNNPRCPLLVIANENNIEGVVRDILWRSEVVIVSPDSISMISEAVASGKYVVVFKECQSVRVSECQTKYEKAIKNLEEKGYIKTALPEDIYDVIKKILEEKPVIKKLDDRNRIIERLKEIV